MKCYAIPGGPWGDDTLPRYTRDAVRVTCSKCLEQLAAATEEALQGEHDNMRYRLDHATGADLDALAANLGISRSQATPGYLGETDAQLRDRIINIKGPRWS